MRFTDSPYEPIMQAPHYVQLPPTVTPAPEGSECAGCNYWKGIMCMTCFREVFAGRDR